MDIVLFGVFAYVLVSLAIGFVVSRRIRTEDDYLVAGRSLGYGLSTFTIFATWFGAETCIGAAGAIYEEGLSGGTSDPFGYSLCLIFMGLLFAVPLWKLRLTTLADLFRQRFSPGVERLAVLLLVPTSMLWAAAQIRAFGQVLSASSGLEVSLMITLAAAVVIAYTMFGGLLADAWTDVIQGIALIVGLVVFFVAFMTNGGAEQISLLPPERTDAFAEASFLSILESWAIPVIGSVMAAELVARIIAAKNPTVAKRSSLIAGSVYIMIGVVPVTIGLVGFQIMPGLEHPEQILPLMAQQYLNPIMYTLFAGALVSAILSTVDSALLAASSLVSHNVIFTLRPGLSEQARVRTARAGVVIFGIIAYVAALYADGVYALVEEASEFGSAGIFIVVVFGLFTRFGGEFSAYAALVVGVVLWFSGAYLLNFPYPYLTSLLAALVAYTGSAVFERAAVQPRVAIILLVGCAGLLSSCRPSRPPMVQEVSSESPVLGPEEALKTFSLAPGFHIELVASEPMIGDPVAIDFDADGRMYVVEMRSYMPEVTGEGEIAPIGRVSVLEDLDGDGRMDRSTVFLDSLVLPRSVKVLERGVLVAEPPYLWLAQDEDGDLRADVKEAIRRDYGIGESNPERNPNGLVWGMDNWISSVWWDEQLRPRGDESWDSRFTLDRGQWGLSMDDFGRVYTNWNEGPLYVDYISAHYMARNPNLERRRGAYEDIVEDDSVWPIRPNQGVNRGYREKVLRDDGTLRTFTAAGSPVAYRGDRYPPDVANDLFVSEPAGNLVRRFDMVTKDDGTIAAESAYDEAEFLASTDERFRPVNLFSGPDGALYVVDMYRGIIQHREYLTEYLEHQIIERGLDKPIGLGRIYRITHEVRKPGPQPQLSSKTAGELVTALTHPNGWWRDAAQRMLVERGDTTVAPALRRLASQAKDERYRLHALWTLDGLGALDTRTVLHAMEDRSPFMRAAAVRLTEGWPGRPEIQEKLRTIAGDLDPVVRWQVAASLGEFSEEVRLPELEDILARYGDDPILVDAALSGLGGLEEEFLRRLLERDERALADAVAMTAAALLNSGGGFDFVFSEIGNESRPGWKRRSLLDGVEAFAPRANQEPYSLDEVPAGILEVAASDEKDLGERARTVLERLRWPGKAEPERPTVPPLTAEEQARFEQGREAHAVVCAPCHGEQGEGREGRPLAGSKWVLGEKDPLIRIMLHGKEGEKLMPPMRQLSDDDIAAVLTFIRRSWGNQALAISPADVFETRGRTIFRTTPWTENEL